jgi:hypothetical protein
MASTSSGVNLAANLYKIIGETGKRQRGGGRVKGRGEREGERNTIPC